MEVVDEMKNDDRKKLEQAMYDQVLEVGPFSHSRVREQANNGAERLALMQLARHVDGRAVLSRSNAEPFFRCPCTSMGNHDAHRPANFRCDNRITGSSPFHSRAEPCG